MAEEQSTLKSIMLSPLPTERRHLAPWASHLDDVRDRIYERVLALHCALKAIEISAAHDKART